MAAPSSVTVRHAAYGTLANGADVRLLAEPDDGGLSEEARAAIEKVFYMAWRAERRRSAPYFVFVPLDYRPDGGAAHWGLIRISHLGRGSMGAVIVAWAAILSVEDLDAIDWATHRLLQTAFPSAHLPETGDRLPARLCRLAPAESSAEALTDYVEAFDRAAYRMWPDQERFNRSQIAVEAPGEAYLSPLSPEGALFGLWERVGRWRADVSYCTWSGLASEGSGPPRRDFDLLLGKAGRDPLGPEAIPIGATANGEGLSEPTVAWHSLREYRTGVVPAGKVKAATEADVAEVVRGMLQSLRPSLELGQTSALSRFFDYALKPNAPSVLRLALPRLLEGAVASVPARTGAELIRLYVENVLPRLRASRLEADPAYTPARLAVEHGALHALSKDAIAALTPVYLVAPSAQPDLLAPFLTALAGAPPREVDWTAFIDVTLRSTDVEPGRLRQALARLAGLAWRAPDHRDAALEVVAQAAAVDVRDALPIVSAARAQDRREVFAAVCRRRARGAAERAWRRRDASALAREATVLLQLHRRGRELLQSAEARS
ncbi:hypothetical protein [Brevundimonas sp.]|uniref:hypothetical protein n=1 Tax=Brevundimonas sp. TaxID=1871086 RepID=UPI002600EFAE|nr:hypothetical protein [Brevundimonas sp.]